MSTQAHQSSQADLWDVLIPGGCAQIQATLDKTQSGASAQEIADLHWLSLCNL